MAWAIERAAAAEFVSNRISTVRVSGFKPPVAVFICSSERKAGRGPIEANQTSFTAGIVDDEFFERQRHTGITVSFVQSS